MTNTCPGLLGVGGVVLHCAAARDPQFTVFVHIPFRTITTGTAGNGRVNKITGGVVNTIFPSKGLGKGTTSYIQDNLRALSERSLVNTRNTLGDIHRGQCEAVTKSAGRDISHLFRQCNLSQLRIVKEGQNADLRNLAAFLKYQLSGILAVCKGIVAHSGNILANYDLLDVITKTCPGLLRLTGKVRHRTGTGDFQRTV